VPLWALEGLIDLAVASIRSHAIIRVGVKLKVVDHAGHPGGGVCLLQR